MLFTWSSCAAALSPGFHFLVNFFLWKAQHHGLLSGKCRYLMLTESEDAKPPMPKSPIIRQGTPYPGQKNGHRVRLGRFCKPNFGSVFGKVRVRFQPGRVEVLPKPSGRILRSANLFRFGSVVKRCPSWRLDTVMSRKSTKILQRCFFSTMKRKSSSFPVH